MIVDTNIILDLFGESNETAARIGRAFARHAVGRRMVVNQIIFAEISPRQASQGDVERRMEQLGLKMVSLTNADAYRAGIAFRDYRRNGGPRQTILPDFLIGAQAATRGWPILTRDRKRFESYFPEVELIDPMTVSHD
jgi:predicted nucleic acid-binding protein